MSYQITGRGAVVGEKLLDEEWLDIVALAAEYDFAAPELYLQFGEAVSLSADKAVAMHNALKMALHDQAIEESISPETKLDRDTVHRVCQVLCSGVVWIRRTSHNFV